MELIEVIDPASIMRNLTKLLHRLINEEHVPPESIAVLTGRGQDSSAFAGSDHFGVFASNPPPGAPGKVVFETARRFKGLDSPVVVLVEMEHVIDDVTLMHVAITRARSHLAVIGSADLIQTISTGPRVQGDVD